MTSLEGTPLLLILVVYVVVLFGVSVWARTRIHSDEDYLVAGRRLPFLLSTATLFATWFGAGTLLITATEIRDAGLRDTLALEPYGAGAALVIAGVFFARPLWEARLFTINDYFRQRFGPRVEFVASLYYVRYLGWIAAQLVGMAGILQTFFELPMVQGILIVAVLSMLYTLIGGMWSVTVTDAFQVVLLLVGLCLLVERVLGHLGGGDVVAGIAEVTRSTPSDRLRLLPRESLREFVGWLGLLLAGTVGNVPGQDLMQRVFSARSSRTAAGACIAAGILYAVFGTAPVLLGLAGNLVEGGREAEQIIPHLAAEFLSPALGVVFLLSLVSLVLSTVDSALLAPSSIFAENLLRPWLGSRLSTERLTQLCVVAVTALSVAVALAGRHAFELLEGSYALGIPPFVVLAIGVYRGRVRELPALLAMLSGLGLWAAELALVELTGIDLPFPVLAFAGSLGLYFAVDAFLARAAARRGDA